MIVTNAHPVGTDLGAVFSLSGVILRDLLLNALRLRLVGHRALSVRAVRLAALVLFAALLKFSEAVAIKHVYKDFTARARKCRRVVPIKKHDMTFEKVSGGHAARIPLQTGGTAARGATPYRLDRDNPNPFVPPQRSTS